MADIMRTIANAPRGVAFHCRSGKDRTGLVAAFLLELVGVHRAKGCADYSLTAGLLISADADKQIDPNQPGAYLRGCAPGDTPAMSRKTYAKTCGDCTTRLDP